MNQGGCLMFKKILVGVDGSSQSEKALETAINIANQYSAELNIATVIIDITNKIDLTKNFQKLHTEIIEKNKEKVKSTKSAILFGNISEELIKFAKNENIDLIILGNIGSGFKAGLEKFFIGSVCNEVIKNSACNVLVVK